MKQLSNGLIVWTEEEIIRRETISKRLLSEVKRILYAINPAIQLIQVETPCLIPQDWAKGHLPFYLIDTRYALRGESTRGTYAAQDELMYKLPVCLYQINKSFRDEKSNAIRPSKHRYREFWQMEFQLFYSETTKADYHSMFLDKYTEGNKEFGTPVELEERPPYSIRTTDLEIDRIEVASLSTRKDYKTPVFEMSFGLDRLVKLT